MRKHTTETTRAAGLVLDVRKSKGDIMRRFEGGSRVEGGFYFDQ